MLLTTKSKSPDMDSMPPPSHLSVQITCAVELKKGKTKDQ